MINCQEADGMVGRYVNNTLTAEEMELFLEHIRECPRCMEELETSFIVQKAVEQLENEDDDSTLDIKQLLEMDIRKKEAAINRRKIGRLIAGIFLLLLLLLVLVFLLTLGAEIKNILLL
ncbi:MAG: zf-HC2 domain-containing protein [Eubacteriales bacterium]|nr:zf-HC2 domain-containing protein [Eubacteriales bacterium]